LPCCVPDLKADVFARNVYQLRPKLHPNGVSRRWFDCSQVQVKHDELLHSDGFSMQLTFSFSESMEDARLPSASVADQNEFEQQIVVVGPLHRHAGTVDQTHTAVLCLSVVPGCVITLENSGMCCMLGWVNL